MSTQSSPLRMLATPSSHPKIARQRERNRFAACRRTFDDAARSESEFEWVVAVAAAVELGAVEQRSHIVHDDLKTAQGSGGLRTIRSAVPPLNSLEGS